MLLNLLNAAFFFSKNYLFLSFSISPIIYAHGQSKEEDNRRKNEISVKDYVLDV